MDVSPDHILWIPVRSKNPQEVWGASYNSRIGISGQPESIQTDEGGEWKNDVRADSRLDGRTTSQVEGVAAFTWILVRRTDLARGIRNGLVAGDNFSEGQISAEVQWRLNTLIPGSGY